jgi:hypothetical protein
MLRAFVNNLVFGNQDPQKLAAGVEEIVRKDIGAPSPLGYRIVDGAGGTATVGSVLVDIGRVLGGGKATPLLFLEFDLPGPRPGTLLVTLARQGVGAYCGTLLFLFRLSKVVGGEVGFEPHKSFGTPEFTGDADAAARLNGAKDLAKKTDRVLRSETDMGSVKVKAPRIFAVAPVDGGSVLTLGTLPRLTSMGMSATTDAKDILEVADLVDHALG